MIKIKLVKTTSVEESTHFSGGKSKRNGYQTTSVEESTDFSGEKIKEMDIKLSSSRKVVIAKAGVRGSS